MLVAPTILARSRVLATLVSPVLEYPARTTTSVICLCTTVPLDWLLALTLLDHLRVLATRVTQATALVARTIMSARFLIITVRLKEPVQTIPVRSRVLAISAIRATVLSVMISTSVS